MRPLVPSHQRKAHAVALLERLAEILPEAHCELAYQTPYQLLVSVVLSAQTTDKMVNRVMQPLYEGGFTPQTVLEWGPEVFLQAIRSIGLAPTKARNVYRLSQILLEQYGGEIPQERAALEALPGVGRKTASVILGEVFRQPTLAVDTHVFRVTRRLGLHAAKTPEKAEQELLKTIEPRYLPLAHHQFILHGRYTCKAIKPACSSCALRDLCPSVDTEDAQEAGTSSQRASKASSRKVAKRASASAAKKSSRTKTKSKRAAKSHPRTASKAVEKNLD